MSSHRTSMSVRPPSTRQFTTLIAKGDADAISHFYNDFFDVMFTEARRASRRDEQFCLDIVQDSMLKVIRSMQPMESESQLAKWTRRLVCNVAYDVLRAEIRRKKREAVNVSIASCQGKPEDLPELESQLAWLSAELKAIDVSEVHLLEARYKWGWTLRRIAENMGISTGAVDGRIRRLVRRIRRKREEADNEK